MVKENSGQWVDIIFIRLDGDGSWKSRFGRTLENGQEGGGLVPLLDANVRPTLLVQLDSLQRRGSLVGGRRLGSVPDEVAETVATQKTVDGRLAFQVLAGDGNAILPADNVRVTRMELTVRCLIQQHFLVIQ